MLIGVRIREIIEASIRDAPRGVKIDRLVYETRPHPHHHHMSM